MQRSSFMLLHLADRLLQGTIHCSPVERLQLIQSSAARLLTDATVLATLHWLPVTSRMYLKGLLLTHKALDGHGPSYFADSLINDTPGRTLRPSDAGLFEVTRKSPKKIRDAAFVNYDPKLWNTLPNDIREANTLGFKLPFRNVYLFPKAFD